MSEPRRHHSVPQFHLRRFTDARGRLWVWDKLNDRVFQTKPTSVAVTNDFYRLHEFEKVGRDPLIMERQLADMETQASQITRQWLDQLRIIEPGQKIVIPKVHRYIVARFITVQYLRTSDTREILGAIHEANHPNLSLSVQEHTNLHTALLWDKPLVRQITRHIREAVWIFARNSTAIPFLTSDNPVAFRTGDNRQWLKMGFVSNGTYAVYPLAPDIVLFCHERRFWQNIRKFDRSLSLVTLTDEMIQSENSGQVFMASRFVISSTNDFDFARRFAKTIGAAPPSF